MFLRTIRGLTSHITYLLVGTDRRCALFALTRCLVRFSVLQLYPIILLIQYNSCLFGLFPGYETIDTRFVVTNVLRSFVCLRQLPFYFSTAIILVCWFW